MNGPSVNVYFVDIVYILQIITISCSTKHLERSHDSCVLQNIDWHIRKNRGMLIRVPINICFWFFTNVVYMYILKEHTCDIGIIARKHRILQQGTNLIVVYNRNNRKLANANSVLAISSLTQLTYWDRDMFADFWQRSISNAFSWIKMLAFWLKFQWKMFPDHIMAWYRAGDKPLSEPMMDRLVYRRM